PFREAHHITGAAVAYAEGKGVGLEDLDLSELQRFSGEIGEDVYSVLDYSAAIRRRITPGGTGPESVAAQITALREWLGSL
ncbi:MAG TPA: argininosuccinate lyase, partial [Pseudodesulfovibrio sp.]|nr:argininosuccinate lyase [Pseudodesulfovibrio sp.]